VRPLSVKILQKPDYLTESKPLQIVCEVRPAKIVENTGHACAEARFSKNGHRHIDSLQVRELNFSKPISDAHAQMPDHLTKSKPLQIV
jgi:hypothetical protein